MITIRRMKYHALFVVLFLSGSIGCCIAEESVALKATLITDRQIYHFNDKIKVTFFITNNSKSDLYVYSPFYWGESGSVSLWVADAQSNMPIVQNVILDAPSPPPQSKDAFVRIPSGHVYGLTSDFSAKSLNITTEGTFDFSAVFHSRMRESMTFGLPVWGVQNGEVESNHIRISVVR